MIVKNISDYQNLATKQPYQYYLGLNRNHHHRQAQHSGQQSYEHNNSLNTHNVHNSYNNSFMPKKKQSTKTKPYFLQGLQYARQFLVQLKIKKQKQEANQELEYSPIGRKNTKISLTNDIAQYNQADRERIIQKNDKKQKKYPNAINDINKNANINKKYHRSLIQNQIDENLPEQEQSIETTKFNQNKEQNYEENRRFFKKEKFGQRDRENGSGEKKKLVLEIDQFEDNQGNQQLQGDSGENIQLHKGNRQNNIPHHHKKQQKSNQKALNNSRSNQNSLQTYQTNLNILGKELETLHNEVENYQIIFDNLCDCYRANFHIYNKNQKLKRQSLKLQQEKQQIIKKIQLIRKESQELDHMERKAGEAIGAGVEMWVREVCGFNQEIQIVSVQEYMKKKGIYKQKQQLQKQPQQPEQQPQQQPNQQKTYTKPLTLNYKKIKQKYEQKQKKKGLLQPKKLQKGVSFEQQIDVITKYYESQMSSV